MNYRIHMVFSDETHDYVDITGDSLEELQQQAKDHVDRRKPVNYWSEEL